MNEVINFFQRGQYHKALSKLEEINLYNNIQEGILYLIDSSVCEGLICLTDNVDAASVEKSLHEISLQCLPVGYPSRCIPLKLELTALFNYGWWLLTTTETNLSAPNYKKKWKEFLRIASETWSRSDIHADATDYEIDDSLTSMQRVLEVLLAKNKSAVGVYVEVVILVLLMSILASNEIEATREKVYYLLSDILARRKMIETLHAVTVKKYTDDKEIFKFGFLFGNCCLSDVDAEHACNILTLLSSICSTNVPESNQQDEFTLSKSSTLEALFNYVEALKSWHVDDFDRSMGLLLLGFDPSLEAELCARYHILLGQLFSKNGDRKKATNEYKKALDKNKDIAVTYYLLGYEYSKMGFPGLMLQHYKKLLKKVKGLNECSMSYFMLDKRILELIHETSEINCAESLYVLAVAYGLNEILEHHITHPKLTFLLALQMFDEAATVFQNLLQPPYFGMFIESVLAEDRRIIILPHLVTMLHEAAVMNLLTGNLSRCQELIQQAMDNYVAEKSPPPREYPDAHASKDNTWIRKLISLDLGDTNQNNPCYEDYVHFFDEDIIGLLLQADLQKIEGHEDARITLNQVMLILSKHMARIRKDGDDSKTTETWQALVKALTCKTCLDIAKSQVGNKTFGEVDKMFRRALSCNNGNQDVIYHYAQFLINSEKKHDAQKLVLTFIDKPAVLSLDSCQSLALKYLLQMHVSQREIKSLVKQLGIER